MRSEDDVRRLVRDHGLADHEDAVLAGIRPAWRLVLRPGRPSPPAGSRVGGRPALAPGETWPLGPRGVPMTFVAQVACSTLPSLGAWAPREPWAPGLVLLRVFADLLDNPYEPGLAAVLSCDEAAALALADAPATDVRPREADGVTELPESAIELVPILTPQEFPPAIRPDANTFGDLADRYDAFVMELRGEMAEHQLLGQPESIQEDLRGIGVLLAGDEWAPDLGRAPDPELQHEAAWRVLVELHDDEAAGLEVADAGAITVLIPEADLHAGRYDRVVYSIDSC